MFICFFLQPTKLSINCEIGKKTMPSEQFSVQKALITNVNYELFSFNFF